MLRCIRLVFLSLFLGLVFAIAPVFEAHAFVDRCPKHQVKTELKSKRLKTRFYRGSIKQINDFFGNHDRSQGTVLAFVSFGGEDTLQMSSEYKFALKPVGGDRYCVMLEKVRATFIAAPVIVMPSNYRKNSCEYKLILKHEKRHLQATYDFHSVYKPKFDAYLGRIAHNVPVGPPVVTQEDVEEIQEHIANYFADKFNEQVLKALVELGRRQSEIDSPEEYRGVGKRIDNCAEQRKNKKNKKSFSF